MAISMADKKRVEEKIKINRYELANAIRIFLQNKYGSNVAFVSSKIEWNVNYITLWNAIHNGEYLRIKVLYNVPASKSLKLYVNDDLMDYDIETARLERDLDNMIIHSEGV